ncbi:hypothetical protein ACFU6N_13785, partial [Streptomyces sp. NPDC057496]
MLTVSIEQFASEGQFPATTQHPLPCDTSITNGRPGQKGDNMTSETSTLVTIDATTALLEAELPRLEQHQQTLEKELSAVTGRLESVRTALTALRALSSAPSPVPVADGGAEAAPEAAVEADGTEAVEAEPASVPAARIPQQAQDLS